MMWNWPWDDEQLDRDGNPIRQAAGPSVPMMQRGVYDEDGNASVMDVPRASVPVAQGGSPYGAILGEGDMEIRDGAWRTRQSNPNNYQNSEAYQLALSNASPRFESPYWAGGNGGAVGYWQRGDDSLLRQIIQSEGYARAQQAQMAQQESQFQRGQDLSREIQKNMADRQEAITKSAEDRAAARIKADDVKQFNRQIGMAKGNPMVQAAARAQKVREGLSTAEEEIAAFYGDNPLGTTIGERLVGDMEFANMLSSAAGDQGAYNAKLRENLASRYGGDEYLRSDIENLVNALGAIPVADQNGKLVFAPLTKRDSLHKGVPANHFLANMSDAKSPSDFLKSIETDQIKQKQAKALERLFGVYGNSGPYSYTETVTVAPGQTAPNGLRYYGDFAGYRTWALPAGSPPPAGMKKTGTNYRGEDIYRELEK